MSWELVVKQPSMLEDLAILSLVKWYLSPVRKCVYPIRENVQIETTVKNVLSTQIEIGRRYFSGIPKNFHDKLIAEAVREISTITKDIWKLISDRHTPTFCGNYLMNLSKKELEKLHKQSQKNMSFKRNLSLQMKLVGQMIEIFYTEKVTSLKFSDHHMTSFALSFRKFNLLTSLTSLTIHCQYRDRYDKIVQIKTHVLEILKESKNLKYLKMNISVLIDDDILTCIVDNCKLIEELDFRSSKVKKHSVHLFTQMPNLKTFHIDSGLTNDCLKTILLSCKRLENIHADASTNLDLIKIIQEIASQADNSDKLTKVKSYSGVSNTSEQILLLANMCPLIDRLSLCDRRDNHIDFRALAGFNYLSHINLEDYSFYGNHVKEALNEIGHNLKSLSFVRDNQTDLNALIYISQKCPNLETLIYSDCVFTNYVPEYNEYKLFMKPFANLKTLHLCKSIFVQQDDNLMNEVVNFLLSNCINIEYVKIDYSNKIRAFNFVDLSILRCVKELKIKVYDEIAYSFMWDNGILQ